MQTHIKQGIQPNALATRQPDKVERNRTRVDRREVSSARNGHTRVFDEKPGRTCCDSAQRRLKAQDFDVNGWD